MIHVPHYGRIGKDNVADDDRRGCFFLLAGVLIVCVSAFLAYREIVYLCFARQAEATVEKVFDTRGRNPATTVIFEFTEAETGKQRRESDQLQLGWRPPPGPLVVQYVPGWNLYVRVAGNTQQWSLWVFGASLAAAIVYIGLLVREANTPVRRRRRR
jgi:hypothetical protein